MGGGLCTICVHVVCTHTLVRKQHPICSLEQYAHPPACTHTHTPTPYLHIRYFVHKLHRAWGTNRRCRLRPPAQARQASVQLAMPTPRLLSGPPSKLLSAIGSRNRYRNLHVAITVLSHRRGGNVVKLWQHAEQQIRHVVPWRLAIFGKVLCHVLVTNTEKMETSARSTQGR